MHPGVTPSGHTPCENTDPQPSSPEVTPQGTVIRTQVCIILKFRSFPTQYFFFFFLNIEKSCPFIKIVNIVLIDLPSSSNLIMMQFSFHFVNLFSISNIFNLNLFSLLYNVVLVSGVQHESAISIHVFSSLLSLQYLILQILIGLFLAIHCI